MSLENQVTVTLEQQDAYSFLLQFDDTTLSGIITDEAEPLGKGLGPNPSRLLVAAIANCLSASLLFSLQKFKNTPGKMHTHATATLVRNEQNRWRIGEVNVKIRVDSAIVDLHNIDRIMAQFEDFCVVTQSVRDGVTVNVEIADKDGVVLR